MFETSSRAIGDVFEGTDAAAALMEASASGDNRRLKCLLSQPNEIQTMLERPRRINYIDRRDDKSVWNVSVSPIPKFEWAIRIATKKGHGDVVSTILKFASRHGIDVRQKIRDDCWLRLALHNACQSGHTAVFKAFVAADSRCVHRTILHCYIPIEVAMRYKRHEIVSFIIQHRRGPKVSEYQARSRSLFAMAAGASDSHLIKFLLARGLTPAGSGALHRAAEFGDIQVMHILGNRGVDLNERLPEASIYPPRDKTLLASWTPMHFAASQGKIDAMEWLMGWGARIDIEDRDGETPRQLLEWDSSDVCRLGSCW